MIFFYKKQPKRKSLRSLFYCLFSCVVVEILAVGDLCYREVNILDVVIEVVGIGTIQVFLVEQRYTVASVESHSGIGRMSLAHIKAPLSRSQFADLLHAFATRFVIDAYPATIRTKRKRLQDEVGALSGSHTTHWED